MRIGFSCYSTKNVPSSRGNGPRKNASSSRGSAGSRPSVARTCSAGDFSLRSNEKHNVCDAGAHIRSHWIPAFAGMTGKICGMMGKVRGVAECKFPSGGGVSRCSDSVSGRGGLWWLAAIVAIFITVPSYADDATRKKTVTSQYYVDTAVETKQPVVGAESGNYVVMYPNSAGGDSAHNEAGEINKRHVSNVLSGTASDNIAVANADIPTVGAVNSGLSGKQNKLSGTSGKLVTYGGAAGAVGSADVYNESSPYSGQTNALVRASHVNSAVANGFAGLLTCNGWETGYNATNDPNGDHCLTYSVNTDMLSGTYVPQPTQQGGQ